MAKIESFEDLEVWTKAREICRRIFEIRNESNLKTDYRLYDQINAASGSIMDNIAEGFERNGNKEFIQFLSIAKASCGEVRSQLYRIRDRDYISSEVFEQLLEEVRSLSRQIGGFITYLQKSDYKGTKFK
ncbi:four helix bundle protein [Christiangramia sabulilitoris]|uniref:Four helix bundle protein n=1 Tax=Christiangramia sabulilitoris TaxID=2583991 RepID=A0A550I8E1_9FLAO|nr:four helix bundle protein [Christiangramia sabulilitoris]TRO67231.1 four helix bundle protein [Christiangramia sabulilitoris]